MARDRRIFFFRKLLSQLARASFLASNTCSMQHAACSANHDNPWKLNDIAVKAVRPAYAAFFHWRQWHIFSFMAANVAYSRSTLGKFAQKAPLQINDRQDSRGHVASHGLVRGTVILLSVPKHKCFLAKSMKPKRRFI